MLLYAWYLFCCNKKSLTWLDLTWHGVAMVVLILCGVCDWDDVLLQATSLSRSCCRARQGCSWIYLYTIQSSANNRMEDEVSLVMLFMNMGKSMGPSTVPWGTPDNKEASPDAWPSTTTLWDWQDRTDSIQAMTLLPRLKSLSLQRSRWCSTLSKAFAKSSTAASAWEHLLRMAARSWDVMISCVSHERRLGTHAECLLRDGAGQGGAWFVRLWCARWIYSRSMSKIRDGSFPVWLCPPSWRLEWPMLSASRKELCQLVVTAGWWWSAQRSTRHCMSSGMLLGSHLGGELSSDSVGWEVKTPLLETLIGGILGCVDFFFGTLRRSSLVYTEENCLLSMSALSWWSVPIRSSETRVPTPHVSFIIPLRYLHKPLVLPSLQSSNMLFR